MAEFAEKTHTDVSLWDALELREPMEGLSKGAHGYVVGWTGSAYELKINNRTYEVLPHQAKHRERPPLDNAGSEIKKEFGTCPLLCHDSDKTLSVSDPYYACCGGQICERCADLLDLHRLSKRKCPLCGKGVEGPSRDSSTEAHAVVCRRRARKGDARAHFSLAAMEAVLSEEEQARHLLLLVDEGRRGLPRRPAPIDASRHRPRLRRDGSTCRWRSSRATRRACHLTRTAAETRPKYIYGSSRIDLRAGFGLSARQLVPRGSEEAFSKTPGVLF